MRSRTASFRSSRWPACRWAICSAAPSSPRRCSRFPAWADSCCGPCSSATTRWSRAPSCSSARSSWCRTCSSTWSTHTSTRASALAEAALRPALRNGLVLFGAGIIVAMVLLATFAGVVAPYDPTEMKVADALRRPSLANPFGTDRFGRDVLSRTIHGSRIALGVAISSIGIALVVGTILGLLGGYLGGATDLVIGRAMDVLFSFPTLILAIGIAAMLGPGLDNAALAIAVVYAPLFSRVARGPVIAERAREYVFAALGLGAGSLRVVFRHILPNVAAPLIVQASVSLAYAILPEPR